MIDIGDIQQAAQRIAPYVHRTPVMTSRALNEMFGAELFFKCENLQKVGAFKARGAVNAVMQLDEQQLRAGVITHSSGNHAQALAYAAGLRGLSCTIVMPHTAPAVKVAAVRGYGAEITFCEPTQESRIRTMEEIAQRTGAHIIPPYDDDRIMAGQGTVGLELCEQVEGLDLVMAPVGGGGLMGGFATAVRSLQPEARIVGAEPSIAADARESLLTGVLQPPTDRLTIADGLRTGLSDRTFEQLRSTGVEIETATEDSIRRGTLLVMSRLKLVIEPSAGVTIGVLLEQPELATGRRVGIVLCGGNVDLGSLIFG
ncbi:MAG: pyridoxal-phosphate dependent enzyme [Candidatus Kapabacteria bacterium]|nr:pyridoxal-phosphate dependent enzyme [Candidatus Kapabacteria bacterium]